MAWITIDAQSGSSSQMISRLLGREPDGHKRGEGEPSRPLHIHRDHLRVVPVGAPLWVELAEVGLRQPAGMGSMVSEGRVDPSLHVRGLLNLAA